MTKQDIVNAVQTTLDELRNSDFVPNTETRYKKGGSTGNLAFNAIRVNVTDKQVVIFVDQSIAPYMPYTNEPWVAEKWNGATNTNAGWWERFVEEFAQRLANKLRGEIR